MGINISLLMCQHDVHIVTDGGIDEGLHALVTFVIRAPHSLTNDLVCTFMTAHKICYSNKSIPRRHVRDMHVPYC